jgi:Polyketide cyclase / dehydrase and lipid transport
MMRTSVLAAACLLASSLAFPAAAIEVSQEVKTTAPPAKVWALIKDFDGIATWLPPAASSPADRGNKIGSVRTLTLKAPGNPTVIEKLTKYAAAKRSYSYDIVKVDPKVLPVVNYHSSITVLPDGHGSKVVWHGDFDAPPGGDENASAKAVVGVYRAGLDNIKATLEK